MAGERNGTWTRIGIAAAIAFPLIAYISTAAVLHYRVERLESDKRDITSLQDEDAEINRRILAQWSVVADTKERVIKLEQWREFEQRRRGEQ